MKRIGLTGWLGGALVVGAAMWMSPGAAHADLVAPLVECTQVTQPAALTTCAQTGQDPLTSGNAVLDQQGNLDVVLVGAGASQVYTIVFRSVDGNNISLGTISTGAGGNGAKSKYGALKFGKDAAGFIVLTRNGGDQYVGALFVRPAAANFTRASFHADLMGCSAVNDPNAITGCGTDTFKGGHLAVNSDTGDITIQVNGAEANATYTAELRTPGGSATLDLGTVSTNALGDGSSTGGAVSASTIAAGTVVLTRSGADQAYGGVRVTEKQPKAPATGAHLVRCEDINFPPSATPVDSGDSCGTDPLITGSALLGNAGKLTVSIIGAAADTTYEVFFRPIDTTGSADVDLGFAVKTGSSGNGKAAGSAVSSGDIGAGDFVLKNAGTDEYFSGFSIK